MPALGGRGKALLSSALLALLSVGAGAQQTQQASCDVDEGSPNQVARAVLDQSLAQGAGKPEDAAVKLKDAIKLLGEGDMKKNPTGRAMVEGKTLVMWLAQPGMSSGITTRGALGFQTDPTGSYDLIAGIDSAFTTVETAMPDCVAQTKPWRQQKGWVDLVNQAVSLANAGKTDSAAVIAKRSLQLSHYAPYAYTVLAQAAGSQQHFKEALGYYQQAIGAAKDSTYADTRRQLEYMTGNIAADAAEAATGADKQTYVQAAKDAYAALSKDPGTKYADAARQGMARVAQLSGDTAAIKASYADQLANPSAFSYNALMGAAVGAARANQNQDAMTLFAAAHTANPYHRDAMYNLARMYILDSAFAKALPVAKQLLAVDPSNPDNVQLVAIAYGSLNRIYGNQEKALEAKAAAYGQRANTAKSAAVIKAAVDSAARVSPLIKAYNDSSKSAIDSALKYNDLMTKAPVRVTFTEFTPVDSGTTLGGTISNLTDTPQTYNVKFQFVDKNGAVVDTQPATVGPVAPHAAGDFKVTGKGAGIIAFKYDPIP
jgi:hypothetical protein